MNYSSIISLQGVSKLYKVGRSQIYALRDVSLDISQGDFVVVTGPSGSGKSTLMNLIGFLDTPTSGKIFLRNNEINGMVEGELARIRGEEIGFVFQNFNLIPRINALENVLLPMTFTRKVPNIQRKSRAGELLKRVGLEGRLYHRPAEMSGGERQRVAIARALANNPSLILADEPTGNLDSDTGREILELFKSLNEEGRTLIVVTHNPMVSSYSKRIIQLRDGTIAV
jgi:putative ABC transport system ATP-binding protein